MSKIRSKNDIRLRDTLTFRRLVTSIKDIFVSPQYAWITQYAVLAGEAVLCILIIRSIRFTNIDWIAYMQQIDLHTQGERDYVKIRGDTGPVVSVACSHRD
ncbi:dolichyl-P-Man:Man(5)GlcNAc(2)-PP-dolichol alpha-1,3-mannosyltransferase [Cystobasidiomycetes sp. EMM_F5]